MNIRLKTQLIFSISCLVVLSFVYSIVRWYLVREDLYQDDQLFVQNFERTNTFLQQKSSNLSDALSDYSNWDDSYAFVQTANPEFIQSSLNINAFIANNFNYLLYQDLNNAVIYQRYVNLQNQQEEAPPSELSEYVASLVGSVPITGYVVISKDVYLVTKRQVFDSNLTKPAIGYVSFVLKVDDVFLAQMMSSTKNVIRLKVHAPTPTLGVQTKQLDNVLVQQTLTQDKLVGTFQMPGVSTLQAPFLEFESPRIFYQHGNKTLRDLPLAMIFVFVVMNVSIFLALETFVTKPIQHFSNAVNSISQTQSFGQQLSTNGPSEIKLLASNINAMLSHIHQLTVKNQRQTDLLSNKMTEVQDQNERLSVTKRAMINLLDDASYLESKIREERDRAQAIIFSMGEGLLAVDEHLRLTIINPVAEKLLGINAKDYLGKKWSEAVITLKGDQPEPSQERTFAKVLLLGKTIVTSLADDHYYFTKSGRKFPVSSITAPLTNQQKVIGAVKVFRDATAEKEQKEVIEKTVQQRTVQLSEKNLALQQAQTEISKGWLALQEEKARLTASIESLPLGFILTDMAENIVIMNPAATKILQLSTQVTQFTQIEKIVLPACDLHQLQMQCQQQKKAIEPVEVLLGSTYLKIVMTPIILTTNQDKQLIGTVVLMQDTTEEKIVERSKDDFLSIASHELRTPLTAIEGETSMILDYYKDKLPDQEVADMLSDIEVSSERLIEIVNDFLNVSKLEQGRIEFRKEQFDMAELATEVVKELQMIKKSDAITLKTQLPNSSTMILADRARAKEVMINLVGNALKYTEHGEIVVQVLIDDQVVKVLVSDTGRGIAKQFQNLLFRKFQQAGADRLTRDATKSTGLGLYIAKMMVEGMGGKIWLEKSELNVGSTFAMTLPKAL